MNRKKQILVISRHKKSFTPKERSMFELVHGKCILTFDPIRFKSVDEALTYFIENEKQFDFIYVTLPPFFKKALKEAGKSFGVMLHPTKKRRTLEFTIVHHVPWEENESVVVKKKINLHAKNKGFRNVPRNVRNKYQTHKRVA